MAKRGRIILKESSLRRFKERADDKETLQNIFGSGFIEG